jgi:hypothetical protein
MGSVSNSTWLEGRVQEFGGPLKFEKKNVCCKYKCLPSSYSFKNQFHFLASNLVKLSLASSYDSKNYERTVNL